MMQYIIFTHIWYASVEPFSMETSYLVLYSRLHSVEMLFINYTIIIFFLKEGRTESNNNHAWFCRSECVLFFVSKIHFIIWLWPHKNYYRFQILLLGLYKLYQWKMPALKIGKKVNFGKRTNRCDHHFNVSIFVSNYTYHALRSRMDIWP